MKKLTASAIIMISAQRHGSLLGVCMKIELQHQGLCTMIVTGG